MNKYRYHDVNWRVFGNVNGGVIAKELNVKPEHWVNIHGFLHDTLGIMNYTTKNAIITFEIKESAIGYSMVVNWTTTKLKSETTSQYFQDIKNAVFIPDHTTSWRNAIRSYLQNLVNDCNQINYSYHFNSGEYLATLDCTITFEKLYSFPKGADVISPDFTPDPQKFSVPHHLLKGVINETLQEALKYFAIDHQKFFYLVKPLEGKEFLADYLMGCTYYLYLDQHTKAYSFFERAFQNAVNNGLEVPGEMLNFMSDILLMQKGNRSKAEDLLVRSMLSGNSESILRLAYMLLQQADQNRKDAALQLVQLGDRMLEDEDDLQIRMAGYHIVASVYLWCGVFADAENAHAYFLQDETWCAENAEIIKPYLLLALAQDNHPFLTNLATDYIFLTKEYRAYFDIWQFKKINPFDKKFQGEFMEILKLVEQTKRIYLGE